MSADTHGLDRIATAVNRAGCALVLTEVSTDTERRLAAVFAEVLGLDPDEISRDDSFFDRGGTSLSAVKLVIALDRVVTLKDVVRTPVLTDLAAVLDGASTC